VADSAMGPPAPYSPPSPPPLFVHADCRVVEFERWDRRMLQHERAYLSKVLAEQAAITSKSEQAAILHEISDIDAILSTMKPGA